MKTGKSIDYACAIERRSPAFRWTPVRIALCVVYALAIGALIVVVPK